MKIYTSYYAKVVKASQDVLLIRVSNTVPNWFSRDIYTLSVNVYPDWKYINAYKSGEISYEAFCSEYRKKINRTTSPEAILQEIVELAKTCGKEAVCLCCYEKNSNTCHRTELARIIDDGSYCGEL